MIKFFSKNRLKRINILIADSDGRMSQVLMIMLKKFGFGHIYTARDGHVALGILRDHEIDILITDWQMEPMDGISLISNIRRAEDSKNRMLPVIMLTARAEMADVESARDSGINEFIVKPYTAKTIFQRIQLIMDDPRDFILSPTFVGPERRRKEALPKGVSDRRHTPPKPVAEKDANFSEDYYSPRRVHAKNRIKEKMGIDDPIEMLITPAVLQQAQHAITHLKDESMHWVTEEIEKLDAVYERLTKKKDQEAANALMDCLLLIKARAGTFGLPYVSQASQLLYRFMRGQYHLGNVIGNNVILIHIRAIKVLFAEGLKEISSASDEELILQLKALANKYLK